MVSHDASRNAQPQSGSFTHFLGSEKRVHDLDLQLRRNPCTTVGHGELDCIISHESSKAYPALSLLLNNRIECVLKQIQQYLPNLHLAAVNGQSWIDIGYQQSYVVMLKASPANFQSFFHDLADISRVYLVMGAVPGQMAHALDDLGDAIGGLHDTFTMSEGDVQRHRALRL